jgi:hypothetical protein
MRLRMHLLVLIVAASFSLAVAAPPPPGTAAGPGPGGLGYGPGAPQDDIVYFNQDGYFDLEARIAKYVWVDGRSYKDNLTFDKQMVIPDRLGNPINTWVFSANGGGNTWYLAFGYQSIGTNNSGEPTYPIWYGYDDANKDSFTRWLTDSGTTRTVFP